VHARVAQHMHRDATTSRRHGVRHEEGGSGGAIAALVKTPDEHASSCRR
jgi:hypothetical protein